jgi:transcriptional regulator with XRE-family HTH domain
MTAAGRREARHHIGDFMILADRLKQLREEKNLSQGDIEKRTGLLRCYVSRCENGHTVPNLSTLEKWAGALGVPMYRLFYDGAPPKALPIAIRHEAPTKDNAQMKQFRKLLAKMTDRNRTLLLQTARTMARKSKKA